MFGEMRPQLGDVEQDTVFQASTMSKEQLQEADLWGLALRAYLGGLGLRGLWGGNASTS